MRDTCRGLPLRPRPAREDRCHDRRSERYALSDRTRAFLDRPQRMLIGGERVAAASGQTFETLDPATGSAIVDVPAGDAADIDAAVAAARAAFPAYARLAPAVRQRLLLALATLVDREAEALAQLESLDNGKAVGMARASTSTRRSSTCATPPAGRRRSRA